MDAYPKIEARGKPDASHNKKKCQFTRTKSPFDRTKSLQKDVLHISPSLKKDNIVGTVKQNSTEYLILVL